MILTRCGVIHFNIHHRRIYFIISATNSLYEYIEKNYYLFFNVRIEFMY